MRLTDKVHQILTDHLQTGDLAIDATAGNGHDTLFLAEQVGGDGHVIAIDIQESAIESTRQKLRTKEFEDRVTLQQDDHASQLEGLIEPHHEAVATIVFNLGYLPGSDKAVQTNSANTHKALEASIRLLRPGGILCVTAYRGHPGGPEEAKAVEDWMRSKEIYGHTIECHKPPSSNTPPILWVLRKA